MSGGAGDGYSADPEALTDSFAWVLDVAGKDSICPTGALTIDPDGEGG